MPVTMTRQQMEDVIRKGGSVLIGTTIHDTVESLPGDAELAQGDAQRLETVKKANEATIAALQAQNASLEADVKKHKEAAEAKAKQEQDAKAKEDKAKQEKAEQEKKAEEAAKAEQEKKAQQEKAQAEQKANPAPFGPKVVGGDVDDEDKGRAGKKR